VNVTGATPISFTAVTEADVYAKDQKTKETNPFPRPIWKTNKVNGMVCFWYDKAVLRRLEKENKSPDAFRQGTSWHVPVLVNDRLTPLCRSKSEENYKLYIRFLYVQTCGEPVYNDNNGKPVDVEALRPFLKPKSNYTNQGTDDPVIILTYALEGIQSITLNGETYEIKNAAAVA
jgi:hypothetical protein